MADGAAPLDVGQLVADHHASLYRYAFRLAGSAVDAEDLTQQVFLIAQQKLDQLRDAQCARSWLFTVLRNCFLKSRRQQSPVSAAAVELDINAVPQEVIERDVDGERLQAAIDSLEDDFKVTLLLFYFEHRSYREIAEVLGVPIGTVMSRLARAKARLRAQLCEGSGASVSPATGEFQDGQQIKRPAFSTLARRGVSRQ
jgi:RNA polymerase sigma-70 factor (ECF subfamily)